MIFTALLEKYGANGERTGWTYFAVPPDVAEALKPGHKTWFRVKGRLDNHAIAQVALAPVGDGTFILPVNAEMRQAMRREAGSTIRVELALDESPLPESAELLVCLADDPAALAFFQNLPPGHQRYYHKWVNDAKTPHTRAKRITMAVTGMARQMDYGTMIRYFKSRAS
jgi:hypothetical protein